MVYLDFNDLQEFAICFAKTFQINLWAFRSILLGLHP